MPKIKDKTKGKIDSESITFRIEKSNLEELRQEAAQKMECQYTGKSNNQIICTMVQACEKSWIRLFFQSACM